GSGMAAPAPPPNVLFIFTDDQRSDTIGALGNPHIQTPNMDRLVAEGTTFTNAYCMGSMVGAVCVPSRAMLMTGRTLFRVDSKLESQRTWPEQFAEAGYATFIAGKWHNGARSVARIFQQGKAIFLGGMTQQDVAAAPVRDLAPEGKLGKPRPAGKIPSEVFTDAAVEYLESRKGNAQPFLCYLAFNLPHDPRIAPPEYHARSNAHPPPIPANFRSEHPFNNGALTIRDERLAPWPRTPEIVRQHLADYYAAIMFLDAQIGRLRAALEAGDHAKDTLIVFASDHGLAIGSHGLFGKQNLYDHSMHAPLIFAGPGIPAGKRSDASCYLLDIFPTLGELTNVPAPTGSEGISLVPVIDGHESQGRDAIFTAYADTQRAVRDEHWKLIVYPQINYRQLFDLAADPHEIHSLPETEHSAEWQRMTALLRAQQKHFNDAQALESEHPQPREFDFSTVGAESTGKPK
ncbi:MAG: sulfatase-like hydrolase/transferase, partial [Chthoniobacteraceae bacterium]